jgi:hypothetical protein
MSSGIQIINLKKKKKMEYEVPQVNQAIVLYMGGPVFLKQVIIGREEEVLLTGPDDLEFHTNWNWCMPVWKKIRKEILYSESDAILYPFTHALAEADLKAFHNLIATHCVKWCMRKQIKV